MISPAWSQPGFVPSLPVLIFGAHTRSLCIHPGSIVTFCVYVANLSALIVTVCSPAATLLKRAVRKLDLLAKSSSFVSPLNSIVTFPVYSRKGCTSISKLPVVACAVLFHDWKLVQAVIQKASWLLQF